MRGVETFVVRLWTAAESVPWGAPEPTLGEVPEKGLGGGSRPAGSSPVGGGAPSRSGPASATAPPDPEALHGVVRHVQTGSEARFAGLEELAAFLHRARHMARPDGAGVEAGA
jgi:hypothetical protein